MNVKKSIGSCVIASAAAVGLASVALATPGTSVMSSVLARAGFADRVDIKMKLRDDQHIVHVSQAGETVIQKIVLGPGGQTGWHSHPGPAIALITRGELTLYSSDDPMCTGRTFGVGQAFVDEGQGHVHLARNLLNQETEVWVTYLDVPPGGAFRIDSADPGTCVF
jgi:hypothetical protein